MELDFRQILLAGALGLGAGGLAFGVPIANINAENKAIIQEQEQTINAQAENLKILNTEKESMQDRILQLESDVEFLNMQKAHIEGQLNTTTMELEAKTTQLESVSATLSEKETLLAEKQTELENAIASGELKDEELLAKQEEIQTLETEITNITNELNDYKSQVSFLQTEKGNIAMQLNIARNNLETKTAELEQANARIQELEQSMEYRAVVANYNVLSLSPASGYSSLDFYTLCDVINFEGRTRKQGSRIKDVMSYSWLFVYDKTEINFYDKDNNFIAQSIEENYSGRYNPNYVEDYNISMVDMNNVSFDYNELYDEVFYTAILDSISFENESDQITKLNAVIKINNYDAVSRTHYTDDGAMDGGLL